MGTVPEVRRWTSLLYQSSFIISRRRFMDQVSHLPSIVSGGEDGLAPSLLPPEVVFLLLFVVFDVNSYKFSFRSTLYVYHSVSSHNQEIETELYPKLARSSSWQQYCKQSRRRIHVNHWKKSMTLSLEVMNEATSLCTSHSSFVLKNPISPSQNLRPSTKKATLT